MTAIKAKTNTNTPIQKLIDEFLFIQSFHHQSDLSPEAISQSLETLAYQPSKLIGFFFPRRRKITIQKISDQHYTFEIQPKLGGIYTELTARGRIYRDEATGKTCVSGDVKFDAVFLTILIIGLFFLITWAMSTFSRFGSLPSPFILFTLGMTNVFYFRQMFLDRNQLLQDLEEKVCVTDLSSAHNRLAITEDLSQPVYNEAEDIAHQPHMHRTK